MIEHFGSLDRNGAGDYDGDGMSDSAEYLAGTNPADKQSALVITQIGKVGEPGRLINWKAIDRVGKSATTVKERNTRLTPATPAELEAKTAAKAVKTAAKAVKTAAKAARTTAKAEKIAAKSEKKAAK